MKFQSIEPPYKRPFSQHDFLGCFEWTQNLTSLIGTHKLYHACHEKELRKILKQKKLILQSKWKYIHPKQGRHKINPGVWTGLNDFKAKGNFYGPYLISFPLNVLEGRRFMVFYRTDKGRDRYYFVQYNSQSLFKIKEKDWQITSCFKKSNGKFWLKSSAIYDILLIKEISMKIDGITIEAVRHGYCCLEKCSCPKLNKNRKVIRNIAVRKFCSWLSQSSFYDALHKRFPDLYGTKIALNDSEDMNPSSNY